MGHSGVPQIIIELVPELPYTSPAIFGLFFTFFDPKSGHHKGSDRMPPPEPIAAGLC
jgi:hypothetical protein